MPDERRKMKAAMEDQSTANGLATTDCAGSKHEQNTQMSRLKEEIVRLKIECEYMRRSTPNGRWLPQSRKASSDYFPLNLAQFNLPLEIVNPLKGDRVRIIDVGAFDLDDQTDLYFDLVTQFPTEIFGFEPQNVAVKCFNEGICRKTVFPWAIGDGSETDFFQTRYAAASSTFEPDARFLEQFFALPTMLEVMGSKRIRTRRLDEIGEIDDCDLLKIDVQGGELKVLKGAPKLLSQTLVVMTEVEFAPLYKDQPLFSDVDRFLREQGFSLHGLYNFGFGSLKAGPYGDVPSRLLWADAVYVKEADLLRKLDQGKMLKAVMIAHTILQDPGLCCSLLEKYDNNNSSSLLRIYRSQITVLRKNYQCMEARDAR